MPYLKWLEPGEHLRNTESSSEILGGEGSARRERSEFDGAVGGNLVGGGTNVPPVDVTPLTNFDGIFRRDGNRLASEKSSRSVPRTGTSSARASAHTVRQACFDLGAGHALRPLLRYRRNRDVDAHVGRTTQGPTASPGEGTSSTAEVYVTLYVQLIRNHLKFRRARFSSAIVGVDLIQTSIDRRSCP